MGGSWWSWKARSSHHAFENLNHKSWAFPPRRFSCFCSASARSRLHAGLHLIVLLNFLSLVFSLFRTLHFVFRIFLSAMDSGALFSTHKKRKKKPPFCFFHLFSHFRSFHSHIENKMPQHTRTESGGQQQQKSKLLHTENAMPTGSPWLICFTTPTAPHRTKNTHPLSDTTSCQTLSSIWALRVFAWVLLERVFVVCFLVYLFCFGKTLKDPKLFTLPSPPGPTPATWFFSRSPPGLRLLSYWVFFRGAGVGRRRKVWHVKIS